MDWAYLFNLSVVPDRRDTPCITSGSHSAASFHPSLKSEAM